MDKKEVLTLKQMIQVFALSKDLKFVCEKIFSNSLNLTQTEWEKELIKKKIINK